MGEAKRQVSSPQLLGSHSAQLQDSGPISPHFWASWHCLAEGLPGPIRFPRLRVNRGLRRRASAAGSGTGGAPPRPAGAAVSAPRAGRSGRASSLPTPARNSGLSPPPGPWEHPARPFTRRASRAAARSVVAARRASEGWRRLGRTPQEGRHEFCGVDVGDEGLGVDVELPAEGRAEVLTLRLGHRRHGAGAARPRPGGLHIRLVPAVGRRVAAAAAPATAASAASAAAGIHDRGGRVCGEERAGNGGGGGRPGRSRPR